MALPPVSGKDGQRGDGDMVCCALLAFLVSQFALAADQIRLLLGGVADAPVGHACSGHAARAIDPETRASLNRAALAGFISFAAFGAMYLMWPETATLTMDAICTSGGLVRRAVLGS
jgi:hypothetical protein